MYCIIKCIVQGKQARVKNADLPPQCVKYSLASHVNNCRSNCIKGHAVAQLVGALRYKSEGRGFDSRWCHWNFSLT